MFMRCDHQIWCDLFAGSGAIGLEALSRGANKVVFVEKDGEAFKVLRANIEKCNMQLHAVCIHDEVQRVLQRQEKWIFDVIYIDPPYDLPLEPLVASLVGHPWVGEHTLLVFERRATENLEWLQTQLHILKQRKVGQSQYVIGRVKI